MNMNSNHFADIKTNKNLQTEIKINYHDRLDAIIRGLPIPTYKKYDEIPTEKIELLNDRINLSFRD